MDPELEEQMKMLEGLTINNNIETTEMPLTPPVVNTMSANIGQVPQPVVAENPTNAGIVTNSTISNVNQQAAAQVVQPTTTVVSQQVSQPTMSPHSMYASPSVAQISPVTQPDVMNQAPVFVNLAASTYQTKTNFLSLKEGEKTRVTLANLNFVRSHIHYIEGLGKIRCLSEYDENNQWPASRAICCQQRKKDDPSKFENAKNRLLVPVVEYPVSKTDGKTIIAGGKPTLKMWDMNYVEEKALMEILENFTDNDNWDSIDVSSFDLALSKAKSGDYATIGIVNMPSWRANFIADINNEVSKINDDFYTNAYRESARVITEDRIRAHINQKAEAAAQAQQIMNMDTPTYDSIINNM